MEVFGLITLLLVGAGCVAVMGFGIAILTLKKYQEEKDDQGRPY